MRKPCVHAFPATATTPSSKSSSKFFSFRDDFRVSDKPSSYCHVERSALGNSVASILLGAESKHPENAYERNAATGNFLHGVSRNGRAISSRSSSACGFKLPSAIVAQDTGIWRQACSPAAASRKCLDAVCNTETHSGCFDFALQILFGCQ